MATGTRDTEPEAGASSGTPAPDGIRCAPFRRPEETVLYRAVQEHLATFLARVEDGGALGGVSGGMRQRVGIAQALLNDPELLIADEPTAGLDPEERVRLRDLLAELGEDRIVILSTHIVSAGESIEQILDALARRRLPAGPPESPWIDVLGPVPERRQLDLQDVAPVVEVEPCVRPGPMSRPDAYLQARNEPGDHSPVIRNCIQSPWLMNARG